MAQSLSVSGEEPSVMALLGMGLGGGICRGGSGRESFVDVKVSVVSGQSGVIGSVIIGTPVDGPDAGAVWPSGRPGTVDTGGSGPVTVHDILTCF